MTDRAQRSRRTFTLVLLACLAVSLICVVYPIYVIRPFRHQGARELALALVVARFRAVTTVITSFTAARDVKLDGAEKVIAVRVGGEARAYPIRSMSYHHVANDVVGGTAIVATY